MVPEIVDVLLLGLCYACTLTSSCLLTMVGPLAASHLGASDRIAPFAVGTFRVGIAVGSLLSAPLFDHLARRNGFLVGCFLTVISSALGIIAILLGLQAFVFVATFIAGIAQGLGQLYRFAAMEVCAPEDKPFAVTLVLSGGIISAFAGPELASRTVMAFGSSQMYLCPFLLLGAVGLLNSLLVVLVRFPAQKASSSLLPTKDGSVAAPATALWQLMLRPTPMIAVAIAALANAMMVMLLSPLVIAMLNAGFSTQSITWTLEAHFFARFAPGLVSGKLIGLIGPLRMMLIGLVAYCGTVASLLNCADDGQLISWVVGMAACGLAWNLCYASGTVMIASSYEAQDAYGGPQRFHHLLIIWNRIIVQRAGL